MPLRPFTPLEANAYQRLGPCLTRHDHNGGWPIASILQPAISTIEPAAAPLIHGWRAILNPETCPPTWLPWLGQAVGTTIRPGTPEDLARAQIHDPPDWTAGTPAALINAIKPHLTGTRRVRLEEHADDNPWKVRIYTYEAETPNPAAVVDAAKAAVEAGINVTHTVETGWTWNDLAASGLTWNDVKKLTYRQLKNIIPGTTADEIRKRYP